MPLHLNIAELNRRLIRTTGEPWTLARIARESDLPTATLYRIARDDADRIDLVTLWRLLSFYRAHGLTVDVSNLIIERNGHMVAA